MDKLFLIRHPQTAQNVNGVQQSHDSDDFTDEGKRQLALLADRIKTIPLDRILSSDAPRCKKTATHIAHTTPITFTAALRDKSKGLFEGMKTTDIDWTDINKAPFEDRKPPQGESLRDVMRRLQPVIDDINTSHGNLAIISHSIPLRLIQGALLGHDIRTSIETISIDHGQNIVLERQGDRWMQKP